MVIDTNLDKLAPLIPKKDQMLQLTADYESFMYYCNVLSNRPSSQKSEIGMFITVVCVVLFVIIIGVVSYIKVSGE